MREDLVGTGQVQLREIREKDHTDRHTPSLPMLAAEGAIVVIAARREDRLQGLQQRIEDTGIRAMVSSAT